MLYICRVPFGAVVLGWAAILGVSCVDNMTKPTAKPAPIVAPAKVWTIDTSKERAALKQVEERIANRDVPLLLKRVN